MTLDDKRPDAVARRRKTSQRTARREHRRPGRSRQLRRIRRLGHRQPAARGARMEDLIEKTPADGLITGIGRVNGALFGPEKSRACASCLRLHGARRHAGQDQPPQEGPHVRDRRGAAPAGGVLHRGRRRPAGRHRRAVGGRPRHHGLPPLRPAGGSVPLVGINSGRCFAGNAALLGCCDVIIATEELVDRHGRPGDDRGRRPRRVRARGGRAR